jgi:hypothetical protein
MAGTSTRSHLSSNRWLLTLHAAESYLDFVTPVPLSCFWPRVKKIKKWPQGSSCDGDSKAL